MAKDMTSNLINPQQIEVGVDGPDGANRLYICCGQLAVVLGAWDYSGKEIYRFRLGPKLERRQFIRAIGTAGVSALSCDFRGTVAGQIGTMVESFDADWDDESEQVEVRIELLMLGSATARMTLHHCSYHVTILAEV